MAKTPDVLDYKKCLVKDIIDWCKERGEVEWLKEANDNSKNFFQLRKAFFEKFMPQQIPQKKKKSYKDLIENL